MAMMLSILIAFSLHALAYATQITFTKIGSKIYAETDPEHFALFGPITVEDPIVSADRDGHYVLNLDCHVDKLSIKDIDEATLELYKDIRVHFMAEKRGPDKSSRSFTWSDNFSDNEKKKFSAVRLGQNTVVYTSEYFPKGLARVIIYEELVIFVHYDGRVVMKTIHCLFINEKILIDGIQMIDPDRKRPVFIRRRQTLEEASEAQADQASLSAGVHHLRAREVCVHKKFV